MTRFKARLGEVSRIGLQRGGLIMKSLSRLSLEILVMVISDLASHIIPHLLTVLICVNEHKRAFKAQE